MDVRTGRLLLLALLLAGCSAALETAREPDPTYYTEQGMADGQYHCAGCHYGLDPVWDARWTGGNGTWDLVVRPLWPDVELLGVSATPDAEPLLFDSGFVSETLDGTAWSYPFTVPAGGTSLFVRFYTEPGAIGPAAPTYALDRDVQTSVALRPPEGDPILLEGPEGDLKQHFLLAPAAGDWTLEATVPEGHGALWARAYVEVTRGQAVGPVLYPGNATLRFAGATPPDNVTLTVRPYHDHFPFETGDWDYADSFRYDPWVLWRQGAAPQPPVWTEALVDPFWDGEGEIQIQADRLLDFTRFYTEDEEHHRDDPVTVLGSAPLYYVAAEPVPPGTSKVRVEVTWEPPVAEPDLHVRLGPASTPYYQEMEAVERGAGRAVFELGWDPAWWDVAWSNGKPALDRGTLDIAPYVAADDGETVARVMQGTLDAWAVRGPLPEEA